MFQNLNISVLNYSLTLLHVYVAVAPVIETQPSHTTVQYTDNNFEMKCTFEAKPPADIIWQYSNGSTLPTNVFTWNSESVTEDTYTSTESKLIWNSESDQANRRNKDGEVNCVASNDVGISKSGDRTLSIECKLSHLQCLL